jgi:hypothetical protein
MAVHLPLVLAVNTPVVAVGVDLRAGDGEERLRQTQRKIAKRVVGEGAVEGEIAIIVGGA